MERSTFIDTMVNLVRKYESDPDMYEPNAQIRVNPVSLMPFIIDGKELLDEIEDNDENVEDEAAAERPEAEEETDYQASQNPEFYSVADLLKPLPSGGHEIDMDAIQAIADRYFS